MTTLLTILLSSASGSAQSRHCAGWLGTRGSRVAVALAATLIAAEASAQSLDGYQPVPTQEARAQRIFGYVPYPEFPHLEIIKNGEPVKEMVDAIPDANVRDLIMAKTFSLLEVRNFGVKPGETQRTGSTLTVPYGASVQQIQGELSFFNWDRGTVNVEGLVTVHFDGQDFRVTVEKFYDSWWLERLGRRGGYNKRINLAFARAVVPSQLELWFNADPRRITQLLNMVKP